MDGHLEWRVLPDKLSGRTIAACRTSKQNTTLALFVTSSILLA